MKKSKLLLWILAALLLAGCSLAQPEQEAEQEDRFVGFYVVRENEERNGGGFYNNPHLIEYGSNTVELDGYGSFNVPDMVLFAEEDAVGNPVFPDLEGYSLYILNGTYADGSGYTKVVSNMAPGEAGPNITVTDEGTENILSGTVYEGPPLGDEDWDAYEDRNIWIAYRVYQTSDGRAYLDGGGNSFTGGSGKTGYTETQTYTYAENGETKKTDTIKVSLSLQMIPRLEKLVVTQFGENNAILQSDDLNLQNDRPELHCLPETAWVLVEEVSSEGTERTVYDPPEGEDPVTHDYVPLDDEGLGHMAYLNIYAQ